MADDIKQDFVPIKDAQGRVTGIMDSMMAEHLVSTKPVPSQASIDALLATITRIRVVPVSNLCASAVASPPLLDTIDPADLASFRGCFRINEDPRTFGHCMCLGDPHFELFRGDDRVAVLGYHHGMAFRWDAWKHDAWFEEPDLLLEWLSTHGVDGPRRELEASAERAETDRRLRDQWLTAMPAFLRPFTERFWSFETLHDRELHRELTRAIREALPRTEEQALALFGWYGSGTGLMTGYPMHEGIPGTLLMDYSTEFLVSALLSSPLTAEQRLGAVRHFAGWPYRQKRKADLRKLPAELKETLLQTARVTGVKDTISRAEVAFASTRGNM